MRRILQRAVSSIRSQAAAKHELVKTSFFGAAVRRHRLERGLSQERLVEVAGLSQRYLSVLERGENSPKLNVIVRLAAALNISPAEVLDAVSRGR